MRALRGRMTINWQRPRLTPRTEAADPALNSRACRVVAGDPRAAACSPAHLARAAWRRIGPPGGVARDGLHSSPYRSRRVRRWRVGAEREGP
jgi:hypothetical protein